VTPWIATTGLALLVAALLAAELAIERRNHARTRAELQRERANVEAARRLHGEARLREAARVVSMREKPEGEE
jgi:hypothetical protein